MHTQILDTNTATHFDYTTDISITVVNPVEMVFSLITCDSLGALAQAQMSANKD